MTREEAIKRFQLMKKILSIPNSDATGTIEAIDMAIEALSEKTSTIQEKHQLSEEIPTNTPTKSTNISTDASADRPRGHWIDMADFEQCSVCHGTHLKEVDTYYGKAIWIKTDFCPNCGADMRSE